MPLPDKFTVAGLPAAFDAMLILAANEPVVLGENVTLMTQAAPALRLVPHAFES
jgi:hypothetical protein